jgi:hypothetical protein
MWASASPALAVGPFAWVPADLGCGNRQASVWRAWPSARVARRPSGEWRRARAWPAKGKTSRSAAASVDRWDILLGQRRAPPYAAHRRFARRVVNSRRTTKARSSHSLPLLTYSRLGGLRQDPGRAAESATGPTTDEDMGALRACVVVDLWGGVTNRWRDWRCGCGRWARRCGCARRPTGRSGRPTRQREGSER